MIKNINAKKGISLIVLLITIAVILILVTTITFSADNIISNTKKRQFAKEIYEVQNLVDKYKYENDDYPYIIENSEKKAININAENIDEQFVGEDIINNTVTLYPIDLYKAGVQNLSRGTNKNDNEKDVYAFSNKTGRVYYVKGYKVRNTTYYTLTDELKKLMGISTNTSKTDSKVIGEITNNNYIQDGLILYLDGIDNTRNGHSDTTKVWEDLSGNNRDVAIGSDNKFDLNSCVFVKSQNSGFSFDNPLNSQDKGVTIECLIKSNNEGVSASENLAYCDWFWEFRNSDSGKYMMQNVKSYVGNYNMQIYNRNKQPILNQKLEVTPKTLYESQITISEDKINCYINGELKETANSSKDILTGLIADNAKIDLGCAKSWGRNDLSLNGNIYTFRIYNRALTEAEIKHNYSIDRQRFLF